ncbi:MAG: glycosyltransferase [Chloroflexi bacterium]|nr:glycosyltransferase [Chloroflexota bacterium]
MKIALLHYSAPPVVGGVESVLAHQARLMVQARHAVQVIAGRGSSWDARIPLVLLPLIDSRHPDVLVVKAELDRGEVTRRFDTLLDHIAAELNPLIRDVDIAILHNVGSLHKNLALTAALHRLNGYSRYILWHHDLAWTTARYRAELHEGYPWDLLRTTWQGARHVVVSESRRRELAELMHLSAEAITVVPNGVEAMQLFKFEAQTAEMIKALRLNDAVPLLLLPVRLTPRKNIEMALHILASLRREFSKAMLVVTGPEGPHNPANAAYKKTLLDLRDTLGLGGAAHFLAEHTPEYLPEAVIADFFRLADALLMPSREEGFGIPLIEAAMTRLLIFCADIPPLRDLGDADVSLFSPEAHPDEVAALIAARLRADAAYRFSIRAKRRFTWDAIYTESIAPLLMSVSAGGHL